MADRRKGQTGQSVTVYGTDIENNMYRRMSLEFSSSWPGEVYLRLETWTGAATMVRVMPGDIVAISKLSEPYETEEPK